MTINHIYNLSKKTIMQGQIRHLRKIFETDKTFHPFNSNARGYPEKFYTALITEVEGWAGE